MVNSAGTAAAPVISKVDDTNTGIFFPAADTIAFAEGGLPIPLMLLKYLGGQTIAVQLGLTFPKHEGTLQTLY
jgi:hypothetical protein